MTNSSPPEPSPRKSGLKRDEVIGVVVAFATIGSVLYWGMSPQDAGWKFNLDKSSNLFGLDQGDNQSGIFSISGNNQRGNQFRSPQALIGQKNDGKLDLSAESSKPSVIPKVSADADKLSSPGILSQSKSGANQNFTTFPGLVGLGGIASLAGSQDTVTPSEKDTSTGEDGDTTSTTAQTPGDDTSTGEDGDTTSTTAQTPGDDTSTGENGDTTSTTAQTPGDDTATEENTPAKVTFSDVTPKYWAQPFITGLAARNIVSGFPDSKKFQPDEPVTRAQLARYIEGAFNRRKTTDAVKFPDIPQGYWATSAIDEAVRTGFMKGYSEGNFQPDQEIPRVQALVALATGLELKPKKDPDRTLQGFKDRDQIPEWAKSQVAAATEAGLVVNYPDLQALNPNETATRAEVAAMIYQALVRLGKAPEAPSDYIVSP